MSLTLEEVPVLQIDRRDLEILRKPLYHCLRVEWLLQMGSQNPLLSVDSLFWEPFDFGGFEFPIL